MCSASGSTHTESGKLYCKVKHRARPKIPHANGQRHANIHANIHIQTSRPQVGSGNGLWADALRVRGADVLAYDTHTYIHRYIHTYVDVYIDASIDA